MKAQKFLTGLLTLILVIVSLRPGPGQAQAGEKEPSLLRLELDDLADAAQSAPRHKSVAPAGTSATANIIPFGDTEIIQGWPLVNCADELEMHVGYDTYLDPDGQIVRSLIMFDLTGISPPATVHTATLQVYLSSSYDYPGYSALITPYRISSPWSVRTVTWNNRPSFGEAYPPTWIMHGAWGWYTFDVTDLVQSWVDGTYPNYGLMLRGSEGSSGWRGFATSETVASPRLEIEYDQSPDYTLSIVPDSQTVLAGQSSASTLYLTALNGFTEDVTLEVQGLPTGASYQLGANPVIPAASSPLTITTTPDTPRGDYALTIRGTSTSTVHTTQALLYVSKPDFGLSLNPTQQSVVVGQSGQYILQITTIDGFTDSVALDVGGLPANTSYAWSTNPVTPPVSATLTITTTPDTPLGTHTFDITGTAGSLIHARQAVLQVLLSDFELGLDPTELSIPVGQSGHYTAHLAAIGGFGDSVTLQVGGLPTNTTYTWSANPVIPPASSILTITTVSETPLGQYPLIVTGTSGIIAHTVQATLQVTISSSPEISKSVYLPLVLTNHSASRTVARHRPSSSWEQDRTSASTAPGALSRIALVIGIADYEHMEPATTRRAGAPGYDLGYTAIDAIKVDSELRTRGGFAPPCGMAIQSPAAGCDCTLYLNAQATKSAIHHAIVNLIDPLEDPSTVITIFFSGHGMYAPDDDGDEGDPYDEFLVPYEIDWDAGESRWLYEMAISDDELASWLGVLESQHIAILVDSCFSGGMIESTAHGTKGLVWQPADQGSMTAAGWQDGFTRDVQGPGRVIVTASAQDQASWEFGALQDGVFTYYLLEALRSPDADTNDNGWISAEEAYAYLAPRVDDYVYTHTSPSEHQNPQISDGVAGQVDLTQLGEIIQTCPSW